MGYVSKIGQAVLYGVEATPGTEASPTRYFGKIDPEGFTPPEHNPHVEVKHELGSTTPSYWVQSPQEYTGGQITMAVERLEFLEYAIGLATDTGAGPYVHTVDPDDTIKTLTIARALIDTDGSVVIREKYLGCTLDKIVLSANIGECLKASINFDAIKPVEDTTTLTKGNQSETPILFNGSALTIGGVAEGNLKSFEYTFQREKVKSEELASLQTKARTLENWTASSIARYSLINRTTWDNAEGGATGAVDAVQTQQAINFSITNGLLTTNLRKLEINGANAKLDIHKYAGFDGHATAEVNAKYLSTQLIATDNTANWDA